MQGQAQDAVGELARIWKRFEGEPDAAIRVITETAARALDAARTSVWLLSDDHAALTCIDLYDAAADRHAAGQVLRASDYPAYFAALLEEETIAADDAHADPRTSELAAPYLGPRGIGAMLDAPLRTGLRLVGVLCHEHVGGARAWRLGERKDAGFLASLASLTLDLKHRAKREALLVATLESSGEGILAFDDAQVLAFNQRFLEMWQLDARAMRSLADVQAYLASKTRPGPGTAAAAGERDECVDLLELSDGRVFERTSRPQRVGVRVVGRVWSFRDVTAQRRAVGGRAAASAAAGG